MIYVYYMLVSFTHSFPDLFLVIIRLDVDVLLVLHETRGMVVRRPPLLDVGVLSAGKGGGGEGNSVV